MKKQTYWKIWICCISFLSLIYGLAHMDQGYRKHKEETPAMAEKQTTADKKAEKNDKIMYLTFNDSPSMHTESILRILDQYHIKATFFVTGMQPEYFTLLKKIHEQGHAIGLHTYSHHITDIYASPQAYFQDLEKIDRLVKEKTGISANFIRFPSDFSHVENPQEFRNQLIDEANQKGYDYYDWNAEINDKDASLSVNALYDNTMNAIQGKKEVMLLLHDGNENLQTANALDSILSELIHQGWEFRIIEHHQDMPVFHFSNE